jgi:hypothetical protein
MLRELSIRLFKLTLQYAVQKSLTPVVLGMKNIGWCRERKALKLVG